jgi:uncharacterized repeat protein (TIGR04138 family)
MIATEHEGMALEQQINWKELLHNAGPYPIEAFQFVREGLGFTARLMHGDEHGPGSRHVSGQQLCVGLRKFAIERYGMLAPTVLGCWNVRRTEDFGRIVFAMIDAGLMSRTEEDTIDDFRGVYHFDEAFSNDQLFV